MASETHAARAEEMDAVLEMVPRVMGATREYFHSAYRNDPWARPEHSRIVRAGGAIVSHIRLYDRWQRVGPVPVHVGCVGDVCTLPEHRGQGHCRALLEDALRYWDEHGYDFSMIVSGVGVYAACGWVPLREQGFTLPAENLHAAGYATAHGCRVRRFVRGEDLTAVAAVYAAFNAERSLTTVRPPAYWERHFSWIAGEIEEAFLVAEREGQIVAYLRCERGREHLSLSECCYLPGNEPAAISLLDATLTFAAKRRHAGIQGILPADHALFSAARERAGFAVTESSVLLFRLVNLRRLLARIAPLLGERAAASGVTGDLLLAVDGQEATLRVRPGMAAVMPGDGGWGMGVGPAKDEQLGMSAEAISTPDARHGTRDARPSPTPNPQPSSPTRRVDLAPETFFGLLFGAVKPAEALARVPEEAARVLAGLFPRGAPVYWRTDVV